MSDAMRQLSDILHKRGIKRIDGVSRTTMFRILNSLNKSLQQRTLVSVLTEAFNTNIPEKWLDQTKNSPDLHAYIKNTFSFVKQPVIELNNPDIYQSFLLSLVGGKAGIAYEEAIEELSAMRYVIACGEGVEEEEVDLDCYKKISEKVITGMLKQEIIALHNGTLKHNCSSVIFHCPAHSENMTAISFLRGNIAKKPGNSVLGLNLNLSDDAKEELLKILRAFISRYNNPDIETDSPKAHKVRLTIGVADLTFRDIIKIKNKKLNEEIE